MPDALLKTVPIWVAVMNRALFPGRPDLHALQCPPPPDNLGGSEVSQIESRLCGFVASFKELQLDLQALTTTLGKPMSIQWALNGSEDVDQIDTGWQLKLAQDQDCNRLILCTASRRVAGAEISEAGYIQGAGDDSESWARGLTPNLFWTHQEMLLHENTEEELLETIGRLVAEDTTLPSSSIPRLINPTSTLYIGSICADSKERFNVLIDCTASAQDASKTFLGLECREGKLGSRDLREKLPIVKDFVRATLMKDDRGRILVTCRTCKDLSAGVALMLLCLFYNDTGGQEIDSNPQNIDKALIKQRIAWISSSMSDVNPSRATLRSVNAFLMTRP